jgi:hypothetical protein
VGTSIWASTPKFGCLVQKSISSRTSKQASILHTPPNFSSQPPFLEALYFPLQMWVPPFSPFSSPLAREPILSTWKDPPSPPDVVDAPPAAAWTPEPRSDGDTSTLLDALGPRHLHAHGGSSSRGGCCHRCSTRSSPGRGTRAVQPSPAPA